MDRRRDATGRSRCPSRRVSPIPIPSARGSGIPSTPTRPSPGPPGLPDIILHGTATLALAVSAALERAGVNPAAGIARITCRFTGMVPLPSVIAVEGREARGAAGEGVIAFQVLGADGRLVLRDGRLIMAGPHDPRRRVHDQVRARSGRAEARAHRPAALRLLASFPRRRPLGGRARPVDAAVSRALWLGLPQGHPHRRLRGGGLGLRRERRGRPRRPPPLRPPRRHELR